MTKKVLLSLAALTIVLAAPVPLSAQTGPNGTDVRPFYVMGHNPNTLEDALTAVEHGANALEPDLIVLPAGAIGKVPGGFALDPFGIVVYHDYIGVTTRVPLTMEEYLAGVHEIAKTHQNLALIFLDVKPSVGALPEGPGNGQKILDAVRNILNTDGVNLNVIINVGSRSDGHLFDTIIGKLGEREGVSVDGEDRADQIVTFFGDKGGTQNIAYGDGTIAEGPSLPRAVDLASFLKASWGFPRLISDIFTIQDESSMNFFINAGADGIIPDVSDPLGPEFTDPDYIDKLKALVGAPQHPEIRMATRDDNPFKPALQAYGLSVGTMNTTGAGTNAGLTFTLNGCRGSAAVTVDTGFVHIGYSTSRMEQDQTDWVTIPSLDLGKLTSLDIFNDNVGVFDDAAWDLGDVAVSSARWIEPGFINNKGYTGLYNATIPGNSTAHVDLTPNFVLPAPTIECPAPMTVNNTPGMCNAVVSFATPAAGLCPDVNTSSQPASGTAFNVGTTNVTSTATSASVAGTASCTFTVTVKDVEGPLIACPGPMTVDAVSPLGVTTTFSPLASDNCSIASVTSVPVSGSLFPIGTTTVNTVALDLSGNQSSCSFTVHVKGAAEQLSDLITAVTNLDTKPGTKNGLLVKLNAALAKVNGTSNGPACGPVADFISLVNAQVGKDITVSDANALVAKATQIQMVLGCRLS